MRLGPTIYLYRTLRGWTQDELARKAGLPRPNLSAIEQGKRDATVDTVRKIAATLGVSAGALVDGMPPVPQESFGSRTFLETMIHALISGNAEHLSADQKLVFALLEGLNQERFALAGIRKKARPYSPKKIQRDWLAVNILLPKAVLKTLLQRLDKYLPTAA